MIEPNEIPEFEKAAAAELRRQHREQERGWSKSWEPSPLTPPAKVTRAVPPRILGLLYDGKRHILFAEPEAAKTLITCMLILEFLRGTPTDSDWLSSVAYIDFENGNDAISLMLAELGATADEVSRVHHFSPRAAPTDRDVYNISTELECGLVVIDAGVGAANASGLDDNDRKDIEKMVQQWVNPFWESASATLVLEHVAKTSDGKWPIGSERKMGGCDTAYFVDPITPVSRGTAGLYKIISRRDRGGYNKRGTTVSEVVVDSDPETHAMSWEFRQPTTQEGDWKPTVLMGRVSEYVIANPGASRAQIERDVNGKRREYIRSAIDNLTLLGHLQESAGSRGSRTYISLSPYTSPDLALTSPGEDDHDLAHLARPLQGGEAGGEVGSEHGKHDLAEANGHVNLTSDERDSLFEDGLSFIADEAEVERLAAIARKHES